MEEIERLHLFDADIDPDGHQIDDVVAELLTGLLVQWSVLIDDSVDGRPVIRFTGPRNQLEELRNRYRGVPGAFAPSAANPDAATTDQMIAGAMTNYQPRRRSQNVPPSERLVRDPIDDILLG